MPPALPTTAETRFKIVYYGPGLGGKTTNLAFLCSGKDPAYQGKMTSVATETARQLFADLAPRGLVLNGCPVRLHLYTTPGPVFYDISRKMVLKDASAVIFVADSQTMRQEANVESIEELTDYIEQTHGGSIADVPLVFQYNKRDLPEVVPVAELNAELNPRGLPWREAVAMKGQGVRETLQDCLELLIAKSRDTPFRLP